MRIRMDNIGETECEDEATAKKHSVELEPDHRVNLGRVGTRVTVSYP